MELAIALEQLEPDTDEHWTGDGLPSMKVLKELTMDDQLKRADVEAVAPGKTRDDFRVAPSAESEPEPEAPSLVEADQEIEALMQQQRETAEKLAQAHAKRAVVASQEPTGYDHQADTDARMEYIKSQNQLRAARAERKKAMLAQIDIKDIDPRSKLDQALARKTARGTERPQRGLS